MSEALSFLLLPVLYVLVGASLGAALASNGRLSRISILALFLAAVWLAVSGTIIALSP